MVVPAGRNHTTMRTKAYDKYVHLREGYMIPMQDGKDLVMNQNVTTLKELQNHPMSIHVNPTCNASACSATGDYSNDDGLVFDLKNNRNWYAFSFGYNITQG